VGEGHVVDRRVALHLLHEPEPLLGEGERQVAVARRRHDRRRGGAAGVAEPRLHLRRQLGQAGALEDDADRELDPERLADAGDQPRGEERVAAQVEEVVLTPTRSTPSSSPQAAASSSSTGVRGGPPAAPCGRAVTESGSGRARRSTLPLGVSGSASSSTKAEGTMCSGRRSRRCRLSSAAPGAASATTSRPPAARRRRRRGRGPPPRGPPGCSSSTASISPGSMRKPRTLTCWSARPRNSRPPSGSRRARSPERYSRAPGSAEGVGDEALGGERRPAEVAARHPRAADVQLPHHPGGHRLPRASSRCTDRSGMGTPIGEAARRDVRRAERPPGDVHGGLGDPVHVDQPRPVGPAPVAQPRSVAGSSASPPKIT
jgi:hypothetical protein